MQLAKRLEKLGTETAFAVSAAAAEWAKQGHRIYPFHLGDMNIPTPANIVEAMNKAIADGYTNYCPGAGILELREVLAHDVGSKRGVSYSPDQVSIQPGGKPVIGKFLSAVLNPGDEALYPNPGYPIYESQIEYLGGTAVPYGYIQNESGFALDMETLKRSITPKTRVLIYNNYQNPTGAQSSRQEMEEVAELAQRHNLWVLSDDAYYEIRYSGEPLSIVNIPGMMERTVILYTCSKRFAMTGWRCGAAIGPKEVIAAINKLNTNDESCTTHFIQRAMVEAIPGDTRAPDAIVQTLRERRDAAVSALNAIEGIEIAAPESAFYLFPNVTKVMERKGLTDVNVLMREALVHTDVSFCTRSHFGRPVPGEKDQYIRMAYSGVTVSEIQTGLSRLKEYFED
ncbi:MAG: aminotransferase class I/II-fold pyridoxal phosphate-dependent enzyme [Caldilineaceae bacterium]|nr:aminotransferase class I/II-fold pyridoxal phosphate-dependent enzyme [Caldilineaceae bacterium]